MRHFGRATLLLGLSIEDERVAAIVEHLGGMLWTEHEISRVCDVLCTSPELAGEICRYGAVTPAHFRAAYEEAFGLTPEQALARRRKRAEQDDHARQNESWYRAYEETQGAPADRILSSSRDENRRRLAEGSPSAAYGTPEYDRQWTEYYERSYVKEARERARAYLADPGIYEDDEDDDPQEPRTF